jgi:hypothetical protein
MEPGKYDVRVQPKVPKNTPPVVEGGGFSVKGPEITSVPQGGSAGETIKMEGKFFTTQKGKVTLDYYVSGALKRKSCKILSWTMDSKNGTGGIEFVVPKGLVSGGDYTLTVTNKVGFVQSGFSIH